MRELPVDDYSKRLVAHWDDLQGDDHYDPAARFIFDEALKENLPRRAFELGCGTGALAACLSSSHEWEVFAWDRSPSMRSFASRRFEKSRGRVEWLDPNDEDAILASGQNFGAFIAQRMAPSLQELDNITRLAMRLVVPRGPILISYWPGMIGVGEDFHSWPPIDISTIDGRTCIRFNEWRFKDGHSEHSWRFTCLFLEPGSMDFERGEFALPCVSDSEALNLMKKYPVTVERCATPDLDAMGVRLHLRRDKA